jgi:mono/diheme cytochrome c family protein
MGLGAAALGIAVLAVIGWATYLVLQARVRRRREPAPQNLAPYMTDDELESRRLNKVLVAALVTTGLMAVVMPIYFLDETSRQAAATERFADIAVERGHEWYADPDHGFGCYECHGIDGGGGAASFIEPRSGVETTWSAPSLNDVFYRYSSDEVRYWLVYGRPGTPMPAWGAEGGGPLNSQQIDELLAYLRSIQVPQMEVVSTVDARVARELARIASADETVAAAVADQETLIADLMSAPDRYEQAQDLPDLVRGLLSGDGTCTARSAALIATSCGDPGPDTDRDGVSDAAEAGLNDLVAQILDIALDSPSTQVLAGLGREVDGGRIYFDPDLAFTGMDGTQPVPDLQQADVVVTEFDTILRDLRLTSENLDALLSSAQTGLDFLLEAQEQRPYAIDFEQIAGDAFEGSLTDARRAVGLFNAYCARCHTAGYSAGIAFTKEAGSGAFGPSLQDGKAAVQFPNVEDHLAFIRDGSDNGTAYGANGIGRGWMPGFGTMLSQEDLMLIVQYERVME